MLAMSLDGTELPVSLSLAISLRGCIGGLRLFRANGPVNPSLQALITAAESNSTIQGYVAQGNADPRPTDPESSDPSAINAPPGMTGGSGATS